MTASWMKQRHPCYPTNQACTVGACAWHIGRTHWYCVQTFGLQRFPMGIVDVLQVEVIVVLAQPGFLQGMVWGLQQKRQCGQYSQLPCTAAPTEHRNVFKKAVTLFWAAVLGPEATSGCTAHACRLQGAYPVMLPCELQTLPWNALHSHKQAHCLRVARCRLGTMLHHAEAFMQAAKLHSTCPQQTCSLCRTSTRWLQGLVRRSMPQWTPAQNFTWMSLPSSRCCSAVVSSLSTSSSLKATQISTAESWSLASEVLSSSPSLQETTSFWMSMLLLSLHAAGPYNLCRNGGQLRAR